MITVDSRWVDTTKNDIVREEGVGGGGGRWAVGGGRWTGVVKDVPNPDRSRDRRNMFAITRFFSIILGMFSIDEGDSSRKTSMNLRFFKLFCIYCISLKMSNVGEFCWS